MIYTDCYFSENYNEYLFCSISSEKSSYDKLNASQKQAIAMLDAAVSSDEERVVLRGVGEREPYNRNYYLDSTFK